MVIFRALGDWSREQVHVTWAAGGRRVVPEVERAIEHAWADASARLGEKLFDGPMCRLERWSAAPGRLELALSRTSYKPFLGTNLHNAALADRFGPDVLANPVGLSTALETADGWLLLGRRNDSVAYYPNRVHPFAGSLEPPPAAAGPDDSLRADPPDVFADVMRELREELAFTPDDVRDIRCVGLVEDAALRQPELIFRSVSTRPRARIEATLDRAEHHATYAVRATPDDLSRAIADPALTPVAAGSLALWGRQAFGQAWFASLRLST